MGIKDKPSKRDVQCRASIRAVLNHCKRVLLYYSKFTFEASQDAFGFKGTSVRRGSKS